MPSSSPKQRRFMAAAANNPSFAAEVAIPQSVAREFYAADQAKVSRRDRIKKAMAAVAARAAAQQGR